MNTTVTPPPVSGLVYGTILNDRPSLERMGEALSQPPYGKPPRAPVLYIKPYNTHVGTGSTVRLPRGADRVDLGATLGVVVGAPAARLSEATALDAVAGYTAVLDLSLPSASVYRPPVREKCFDGACPMGPEVVARAAVPDPSALTVRTFVNGAEVAVRRLSDLVRPVPRLLADVTEFMTLNPGDVLLAGVALDLPQAGPGDRVAVEIAGVGRLDIMLEGDAR
ncbi:fumarylacetoacetate hydrolase family protein [Azospirillum sp.]|uniref:fumarylacetoacetate hydrolase family protein n=1 Tax=Azospirillum sp. TaxID=34012 RepID=UPI002D4BD3C9|nr:fumarylacetoacetate hydrolase family protein [Azospirillum sp.]HYD68756.1 fumarylacetoacetate hydrolase family protein [Azospirillum sp.]